MLNTFWWTMNNHQHKITRDLWRKNDPKSEEDRRIRESSPGYKMRSSWHSLNDIKLKCMTWWGAKLSKKIYRTGSKMGSHNRRNLKWLSHLRRRRNRPFRSERCVNRQMTHMKNIKNQKRYMMRDNNST
jgi:hypothetical protein